MITSVRLRNFKSIEDETFKFTEFDLIVGRNNSGKSTVLQALAIWQFCVDEFHRSNRKGVKGIQIVLPNFTALPVPEFNLLWRDRADRHWPTGNDGRRKQEYILVGITLEWRRPSGEIGSFGIELRYQSPQTIYAIPTEGWVKFRECEEFGDLPRIAYVPPFSGLEPTEKWLDISPIRQQVGKGQPGSVLRNLLLKVNSQTIEISNQKARGNKSDLNEWQELALIVKRWFGVTLREPRYDSNRDVYITVEYRQNEKDYDIISGGSGFHQTLTLLAFLYGYQPTTILIDEPDAHLHVNLQRELLDYFKSKSDERNIQFLIATHAEEFARGVDASQIVSLLSHKPTRIISTPEVLRAMADVTNEELTMLIASPHIVYVEGESDERILRAWAQICDNQNAIQKVYFKLMGGGSKDEMKKQSKVHFDSLKCIIPNVKRIVLFDYDTENSFHPEPDNEALFEWKRKNIENYLLVPDAWKRATVNYLGTDLDDLLVQPILEDIDEYFASENLTLPTNRTWRNVSANVFKVVDGKRILFENNDSLFHKLRQREPKIELIREKIALNMLVEEIHEDVHELMNKLLGFTSAV